MSVPVAPPAAPDAEPGFVGPEGTIVGHGPIRLGATGLLAGNEPAEPETPSWAAPAPAPGEAPAEPVVDAEPAAPAEPAPSGEPEAAFPGQPEAAQPPAAADAPAPDPELSSEPAWRRHMPHPSNPFRHGSIKVGGKPAGKPPAE